MSSSLETRVAEFLARREGEPDLSPEEFVRELGANAELLAALRATLDVDEMLPDAGLLAPRRVAGYSVLRELGRGGMGVVYEVERDGARFALKCLTTGVASNARQAERFRREAEILARLDHPGVVRIFDSGIEGDVPYIVMELVEGEPLAAGPAGWEPARAARLVAHLCSAVQTAHEAGVLHRDLKPQNVIVRPDGAPVLLDFGLTAAADLPSLTSTGDLLGTPRYMAPEQAAGRTADARTDVHALGLILYELLTGRPARSGQSSARVVEDVRDGRFVHPRKLAAGLPADLVRVVLVALAWSPRNRYGSASAMARDLERWLAGESVVARPPGRLVRWTEVARRKPTAALACALGVLVVSIGAWLAFAAPLGPSAETLRAAEEHVERAVGPWLDGDAEGAREELARARELHAATPAARALDASLNDDAGDLPRDELRVAEALRALRAGRWTDLEAACAELDPDRLPPVLWSVLAGTAARARGDAATAVEHLTAAARELPDCRWLASELGEALVAKGDRAAASAELRRALDLGPPTLATWQRLAETYLELREHDAGLRAADEALALAGATPPVDLLLLKAKLCTRTGRARDAMELLRAVQRRAPDEAEAWFLRGVVHDFDHDLVRAEQAYQRAVELDPGHAWAFMLLAHLYAGADRGSCHRCDQAYGRQPRYLAKDLAGRYVVRALEADLAGDRTLGDTGLSVGMRLEDRGPLIADLERLLEGDGLAPERRKALRMIHDRLVMASKEE